MSRAPDTWILTADCPSVLGTVDAVTRYLFEQGCYVTEHHSFDDRLSGRFFIRVEFRQPDGFDEQAFRDGLATRGQAFGMIFELTAPNYRPKVVIMVSKADHCLNDLLYRQRIGQLSMDVVAVVSNHPDLKPLADWLRLNLLGFMHACQALLPSMIGRRWGRIVGINSDAARTATGMGLCAYGAAKAGALGFVRNLSGEVGRHGITVNALSLGTMNNWEGAEAMARKTTTVGRAGSPDDVGAACAYLASDEASWVTGQLLPVNGGGLVA